MNDAQRSWADALRERTGQGHGRAHWRGVEELLNADRLQCILFLYILVMAVWSLLGEVKGCAREHSQFIPDSFTLEKALEVHVLGSVGGCQ